MKAIHNRTKVKVLIGIAIIASLAVLGASCGDDDDDSSRVNTDLIAQNTQQPAETTTTTVPSPVNVDDSTKDTASNRVSPEPDPETRKDLDIVIKNGSATTSSITNPDLVYSLDDDIIITVNTDVDGEVHIHTYDDSFFIVEGAPVTYEFYPHIPGEILIELEETKLELARITIE